MATRLRWLGHSCLWIESDGIKLLVDPFLTGNPKAVVSAEEVDPDFICVSHGHGDHVGDTVAIAQRNLTISVQESSEVSQPQPFSRGGETVVVPQTDIVIEEELGREIRIVRGGASLSTLVNGLNALGVSPRDMISILQAIKAAGALQAEIEVM